MCYGDPTRSLEISRETLTPEQWEKLEADFEHFCAYSGLEETLSFERSDGVVFSVNNPALNWAKFAFLKGRGL
jgi:hypothetical protein